MAMQMTGQIAGCEADNARLAFASGNWPDCAMKPDDGMITGKGVH